MIQQCDPIAGAGRKAHIGIFCNAAVFHMVHQQNPVIFGGIGCRRFSHLGVLRIAGIHQHQLPLRIGLCLHTCDHLAQKRDRRVVQGHHHAEHRPLNGVLPLHTQLALGGNIGPMLPLITVQSKIHAKIQFAPQLLGPLFTQGFGAA